MFKITFLGTSSGMPTLTRNTSATAIECMTNPDAKRHRWLLVDCGEGTWRQLLHSHLSINQLSAILITHTHGDHCYGLGGLLAGLSMYRRDLPLTIIAPKAIIKLLDTLTLVSELSFSYPIDFIIIEEHLDQDIFLDLGGGQLMNVRCHALSHRIASYGFEIIQILQKDRLLVDKLTKDNIAKHEWHRLLQSDDLITIDDHVLNPSDYKVHDRRELKIVVAGDNDTPELLAKAVMNCQALIHEATYTDDVMTRIINKPADQGGFNPKHASVKQVALFAQACHVPTLILTHFSARYAPFDDEHANVLNMGHVRAEAVRHYDGKLVLAHDFLQVIIDEITHKNQRTI